MSDKRRRKLARLLVDYSTEVQPGDWVGILGNFASLPILRDIYEAVVDAGGFPSLFVEDDQMQRYLLRNANDDQMQWIDPRMRLYVEEADVYIRAMAQENTRAMTNIDVKRSQMQRASRARCFRQDCSEPRRENSAGWVRSFRPRRPPRKPT